VVQKFGTVVRNIDVAACTDKGVAVEILRRRVNIAVAEQALALMLALAKRICELKGVVDEPALRRAGFDPTPYDRRYTGNSNFARIPGLKTLFGSTLGIIGMGEIGREVASRGASFGMRILYYQRNRINPLDEMALSAAYAPLEEVMEKSDYISIQLPASPGTRGLLGRNELTRIKPGAVLVNVARAELIDHEALLDVLSSGRLGGFALDVGYSEPANPDDPLLNYRQSGRVILMPHTAVAARQNNLNDLEEMCLKLWRSIQLRQQSFQA
jgi:phosphoglycerate dehydrogenase-like enzyme